MNSFDNLPRTDAQCTTCGQQKRPTKAYLRLLKSQSLSYVCQACRQAADQKPIVIGSLGVVR